MPKITTNKQIGSLIKDLRKKQNMTGVDLAKKAGLSQSKISKIETGLCQSLSPEEITKMLNILNAPKTITQRIYRSLSASVSNAPKWRTYGTRFTANAYELEKRAALVRIFMLNSVPALLQTLEYRVVGLKKHFGVADGDLDDFVKDIMKRQDLLWDRRKRFEVIMHQAALYSMRESSKVQLAQLDRLERLMGVPNLKLGIIPLEAGLPVAENGSFALFDDRYLSISTASGDIQTTQPRDVGLYVAIFKELTQMASYDYGARELVRRAIDYFS